MFAFFPIHIAGQILVFDLLTAATFWWIFSQAFRQMDWPKERQRFATVIFAAVMFVWFCVVLLLAQSGLLRDTFPIPPVGWAFLIPVFLGSLLFFFPTGRKLIDAMPFAWLVAGQGLRIVFGYAFLAVLSLGAVNRNFALPAGYGDILAGLLGLLMLVSWQEKLRSQRWFFWVFSVVGMLDFVAAFSLGITQIDPNGKAAGFYPFGMIPGFVVPIFFLMHLYAIRLWIRKERNS